MAEVVQTPHFFVDFLRDPTVDAETGEIIDAHPSFYELLSGSLLDLRSVSPSHDFLSLVARAANPIELPFPITASWKGIARAARVAARAWKNLPQ